MAPQERAINQIKNQYKDEIMDYKETVHMLGWMAKNAKLSGTDARVLTIMATEAGYKTAEFSASYEDMAKSLKTSKQSIMLAVKRLEKSGAIKKINEPIGRAPATYKLRNIEDLCLLHETDEFNLAWRDWTRVRDNLFHAFENQVDEINSGCEDCTDDALCLNHEREKERLLNTPKGREMRLWYSDNPAPKSHIKTVKFIEMDK
jgi:hypothetical protein